MKTLNIKDKQTPRANKASFVILFFTVAGLFLTFQKVNAALTSATTPTSLPSQGLVTHHTFDGKKLTTTTATDSSGQGNDGTLQNGPVPAVGKVGQALYFDGIDDYVSFGGSNVLASDAGFTMSVWIKHATTTADSYGTVRLRGVSSEFLFEHGKTGASGTYGRSVYFGFRGNTAIATSDSRYHIDTSNGKWNHYIVIYNGGVKGSTGSWRLYINGEDIALGTQGAIGGATNASEIGRDGGFGFPSQSYIDDVRVYNRPLSSKEVAALAGIQAKSQTANTVKLPASSGSLVGWWTLDGKDSTATTVTDRSGNAITGTFFGSPTKVLGKVGQALYLNGSQYVSFGNPSALNFTGDMTASFWVKPAALPGDLTVLLNKHSSGSAGFAIQQHSGDFMFAWGNGSTYTCDTLPTNKLGTLTLGVWQHVVIVKSGTTATGYVNGVQSGTCTGAFSTIATNGDPVLLGRWSSSNSRYFNGSFDDVYMYNKAISVSEVQTLYRSGQTTGSFGAASLTNVPVSNGLVAYHTFDGKYVSGTTATDRAGSNTGTMTGGMSATSSARLGKVGQAIYFDGMDDRIDLGSAALATDSGFSLSFWAKNASSTSPYMTVRLKGTTTEFTFAVGHCSYTSLPTVFYFGFRGIGTSIRHDDTRYCIDTTLNKWVHYTVTYNGAGKTNASSWRLYVNGVAQTGFSTGANIGNFSNASELGSDGPNGGLPSNYALDDLRVYNRVITSKEALTIYNSGK